MGMPCFNLPPSTTSLLPGLLENLAKRVDHADFEQAPVDLGAQSCRTAARGAGRFCLWAANLCKQLERSSC